MHAAIAEKCEPLTDLCRRYGVARLDVFGSAARGADFDQAAHPIFSAYDSNALNVSSATAELDAGLSALRSGEVT